ncbi:MAG: dTDP-4-dehydrorhamnose 3,5-epimerase [Candidatus Margulisbacteria bacterium]|nr:dTDP-4-dehydrorhamnose 3,5-epimerase [Candidatus Margulisiibacteriota bacterium]MBU1021102.1 dTDP-4-dehydrorhamnose 3,5-epimerase [Candidatus Margulisiibacteriota bacterium]MBU1728657.1 dTDP-4-dehydrorhamnose 3,5-epimerase [Candidatus Margulisiibacteriota bacterium]MBU1955108.1 dTDP-4-dehydrorhamnose 3,5-epimerase [Candidatus Margulisiibacteriota bacterium]
MKFSKTKIDGVIVIEPRVFGDHRGFFMETYKKSVFANNGIKEDFVQDNHSRSVKGVLRGLHYQLNTHPMGKLVRALVGEVFDVGVDLRKGSPTYGQWFGDLLSAENKKMIYFPPGIAHGFCTVSEVAEVFYKCTGEYNKESERALIWNDPEVGIKWPIKDDLIILSDKDKINPGLKNVETDFVYGQ